MQPLYKFLIYNPSFSLYPKPQKYSPLNPFSKRKPSTIKNPNLINPSNNPIHNPTNRPPNSIITETLNPKNHIYLNPNPNLNSF